MSDTREYGGLIICVFSEINVIRRDESGDLGHF